MTLTPTPSRWIPDFKAVSEPGAGLTPARTAPGAVAWFNASMGSMDAMNVMNAAWMIDRLERFPQSLVALLSGIADEDARWRPGPEHWSMLEIVCHLVDEDLDDFGTRLRMTLEAPQADWPTIDPVAAAIERDYRGRNLETTLREFRAVRRTEVAWLRTVEGNDFTLEATHPQATHPRSGSLRAGDLLAAWCAHDALHLRQLARRLHELTVVRGGGFDAGYAGDW